jgi:hypothetical protein
MRLPSRRIFFKMLCLFFVTLFTIKGSSCFAQAGINDTTLTGAVVYEGDTIPARTLYPVYVYGYLSAANMSAAEKWTRLRNAVYVTYPYARRAGAVLNDMNKKLATITDGSGRRDYIKSREKDLKREFTDPLTNLSVYQGRVLMKLINRETGNNCYDIIKEYKGGITARFWQTVAFFFNSSLKQPYDPTGEDAEMEKIVLEVCRMYGYKS